MRVKRKSRAFNPSYESPGQLSIEGFETPFARHLRSDNRWVVLAGLIPRDETVSVYPRKAIRYHCGRKPLNPRIVIGSLIIKHILNLDDREAVAQIAENVYPQYFLGYSSFIAEELFDASLFVNFCHALGDEVINSINEKIVQLKTGIEKKRKKDSNGKHDDSHDVACDEQSSLESSRSSEQPAGEINKISPESTNNQAIESVIENRGTVIMDATCCPQDIAYPTDLTLLSDAREKAEEPIDFLYDRNRHGEVKPRTYRKEARKEYLHTAQKKNRSKKEIRKAVGKRLRYLKRDIGIIHRLPDSYSVLPFRRRQLKYFHVIQTLYAQ
jgi:hypothetical protein